MSNDALITTGALKTILPLLQDKIIKGTKCEAIKIVEPMDNDLPTVYISGDLPESKKYVSGELEYISKTTRFHAYTLIKLQGNSTLQWPKKNFTINLYSDENRSQQLNKEFKNWGFHNNFVLKADYLDVLHARNVVSAKLWGKIVGSRSDYDVLPEELRNSPNNGAIDGFPIRVYINGDYKGLYSWTIPKCDWMFGMDLNNSDHILISSEFNDNGDEENFSNPCNFNYYWNGDTKYFDFEIDGGNDRDDIVDSINSIICSVWQGSLDDLVEELDINSVIDYFIFQEVILGVDGLAKNMLLATYDNQKWYLSAYDMDSTFNLNWDGEMLDGVYARLGAQPYLNSSSSLQGFVFYWCHDEYLDRYIELRKSVLSYNSIINEFESYINIFGEDIYIQDTAVYPDIPNVESNTLSSIRTFVKARLDYLDSKNGVVI